jgi:hypothetical protein
MHCFLAMAAPELVQSLQSPEQQAKTAKFLYPCLWRLVLSWQADLSRQKSYAQREWVRLRLLLLTS